MARPKPPLTGKIAALVRDALNLNDKRHKCRTPAEADSCQRQMDAIDREIDRLVYELYDLTTDEIGAIEGGV